MSTFDPDFICMDCPSNPTFDDFDAYREHRIDEHDSDPGGTDVAD